MKVFKSGKVLIKENEFPKFAYLICLGNINIYKFKNTNQQDTDTQGYKQERFETVLKLVNEYIKREFQLRNKLMGLGI